MSVASAGHFLLAAVLNRASCFLVQRALMLHIARIKGQYANDIYGQLRGSSYGFIDSHHAKEVVCVFLMRDNNNVAARILSRL